MEYYIFTRRDVIGLTAMEADEALHGAFDDGADSTATCGRSLGEDIAVVVGYRTDEVDLQILVAVVLAYVAYEERLEGIENQGVDGGILDVLDQERCYGCEETVGLGLLVDATDNSESVEFVLSEEFLADILWQLVLEDVADKNFSEDSARTLVAEDVS